jgi:hypothetical protein
MTMKKIISNKGIEKSPVNAKRMKAVKMLRNFQQVNAVE